MPLLFLFLSFRPPHLTPTYAALILGPAKPRPELPPVPHASSFHVYRTIPVTPRQAAAPMPSRKALRHRFRYRSAVFSGASASCRGRGPSGSSSSPGPRAPAFRAWAACLMAERFSRRSTSLWRRYGRTSASGAPHVQPTSATIRSSESRPATAAHQAKNMTHIRRPSPSTSPRGAPNRVLSTPALPSPAAAPPSRTLALSSATAFLAPALERPMPHKTESSSREAGNSWSGNVNITATTSVKGKGPHKVFQLGTGGTMIKAKYNTRD
mmetsp:Transcript_22767/g.51351  ORF Transcript_22767/g.51351 Transcript_22767/m.51351 type:complete len:268 (+) Transcript_22767:110-913(+)